MRELFAIDTKDYNPDGLVHRRPSARAIIERDGKVLVMHSRKYDYFKFPGGGIEQGETPEQALVREVREESGCCVRPETIEEFGSVLRRNRDAHDPEAIFEQWNYYYFCDITDERVPIVQEDYEIEERFEALWADSLTELVVRNRRALRSGGDATLIEREMRIFDMADNALRRRRFEREEAEAIRALGEIMQEKTPSGDAGRGEITQEKTPSAGDYAGMLDYVKSVLEPVQTEGEGGIGTHKREFGYSRFEHTKRVLGWAKRLYERTEDKTGLRYEDLMIATIFHDVGRSESAKTGLMSHAAAGVPITREYLLGHGFPADRTEYICGLVGAHSDKWLKSDPAIDRNLLMLMEADDLDDMGALGIVMDCMVVRARNDRATYYDCYNHLCRYTRRIQRSSPMVTPEGRAFWDEETALVERFLELRRRDLTV